MDVTKIQNLPPVLPEGFLRESLNGLLGHKLPKGYKIGIKELDDICRFDKERLITVTGVPGSGKSEYMDFITTSLNKRYGLKTLYFSPENMPVEFHLDKLIRKFTCKPLHELTDEERETAVSYILNNFFFINCYDVTKLSDILRYAEEMVIEKHIDILVIDPYNRIDVEQSATDIETQYISRILDELSRLAIKHHLMVFLVAHPRKMSTSNNGRRIDRPTAYDINGSANFFNKSDYVVIVHRENRAESETIVAVDKVKFANYGQIGETKLEYDRVSGNYFPTMMSLPFDDDSDGLEDTTPKPFVFPKPEAAKSPLDVMVSMYPGVHDKTCQETVSLKDFLMTDKYKDVATLIRSGRNSDERHDLKVNYKGKLPCVTPSGIFSVREGKSLTQHSGLLCIDIDLKDNPGGVMDKVPPLLESLPYVAYASKSISGDGYFAIVPLEHPSHHLAHYLAIEKEFKEQYGIVLDQQCKDVCRLRFATYDESPYYNPQATPYYQEYTEPPKQRIEQPASSFTTTITRTDNKDYDVTRSLADLDKKIEDVKKDGIIVANDYKDWQPLAMSLSTLGEDGRVRFHAISSTSPKYDKVECDKFYSDICKRYKGKNRYTLRTAHKIINDAIKAHHV